jgi:hypothetical protein
MATIPVINGTDGVFDILNDIFAVQVSCDTDVKAHRTSWNTLVTDWGAEFSLAAWVSTIAGAEQSVESEESSPSAVVSALREMAAQVIIAKVDASVNLVTKSLDAALVELVGQMNELNQSFLLPTVTIAVAADAGNTGDCFIIGSRKTTAGINNAQILAEVVDVTASVSNGVPNFLAMADATSNALSPNAFGGSGVNGYLAYYSTNTGLTGFGGLNPFVNSSSVLPGNWIANVGTLGTAVLSGLPQNDTITVSGTPSAGTFRVTCTTTNLGTQSTINLPYNATAAQIQAAIASMVGFSKVSISSTGTGPNYTHSIVFYGMREAVTTAVVNSTTGGTFVVATPTAYSAPSLGSSPITLVSDGSTLVSVSHQLTNLIKKTAYAVNAWLAVNTSAASGVIEIALTNGVGGAVIQDDAGNSLSYTVNATSLATTYKGAANLTSGSPIFMTPSVLPASVYLRIRCSTTLPNTRKVFVENVVIAPATQLYTGGPFVAVFCGPAGPGVSDVWTITTANNYAGKTSWAMERNFNLRERGLTVPHVAASPTITDGIW